VNSTSPNRIPLAIAYRAGRVEAVHHGDIAVSDVSGNILFALNDPHYRSYPRSSIKMIQALPVVLSGAADRFGFTEPELAVCCASHEGASYHLEAVASILRKIGLTEADLGCGAHEPGDRAMLEELICSHHKPSQLHNNCSGKHSGMLAACVAMGWPTENYLELEHPLQQWILKLTSERSGIPQEELGVGIDGCSLPNFYMPISALSTTFARFTADAFAGDEASGRIFRAVAAYPEMINRHGGFDSEIIRVLAGRATAKRGAMAIYVVGINSPQYGPIGVTVKIADGNMMPMPVIMMRVLEQIGAITPEEAAELGQFRQMILTNWRGITVGEVASEFELEKV
jgi:L-asparaginase II